MWEICDWYIHEKLQIYTCAHIHKPEIINLGKNEQTEVKDSQLNRFVNTAASLTSPQRLKVTRRNFFDL